MHIYDKKVASFWYKIRKQKISLNDLIEFPALKKMLPNVKNKSILDVGCGTGETAYYLAEKGALVTAIEPSVYMLDLCKNHKNIRYFLMKAKDIGSFSKESFDIIICEMVLDNIRNLEKILEILRKVLKKNGHILISIPHPFRYAFEKKSWDDVKNWKLRNYFKEGRKQSNWNGNIVTHYHRKLSSYINLLLTKGFHLKILDEPLPNKKLQKVNKKLFGWYSKVPFVLLIEAKKTH